MAGSWLRPSGEHQGHKHGKDVGWLGVPQNPGLELAAEIREEPSGAEFPKSLGSQVKMPSWASPRLRFWGFAI